MRDADFGAADISLCSGLQVCVAPQVVPTAARTAAGQPGLLRPGRTCFVTSACTGYANRPNSGNWDIYLTQVAPICSMSDRGSTADGGLPSQYQRVGSTIWHRGGLP